MMGLMSAPHSHPNETSGQRSTSTRRKAVDQENPGHTAIICLSPSNGGMELDAAKTARMLSTATNVVLIVKRGGFLDENRDLVRQECVFYIEEVGFHSSISLPMVLRVRAILKRYHIENVIYFGASELKSLYFAFRGLDLNIMVRHGTTKYTRKTNWLHRLIYRSVSAHIVNSKHLDGNVRKIFPIAPTTEVTLIYPSTMQPPPTSYRPVGRTIRLIHVGRICRGKGQDVALRAIKVLKDAQLRFDLTFVGDTEFDPAMFNQMQKIIDESGLQRYVHFTGHVHDVHSRLHTADVFLFPSAGEGFSNALVEALLSGLVPIVFDNTAFPEAAELGFHLHMTPDGDEKALANVLLAVCINIENEKKRAFENAQRARNIFSSERERSDYLSLLWRLNKVKSERKQSAEKSSP